jgi:hypothetical protein
MATVLKGSMTSSFRDLYPAEFPGSGREASEFAAWVLTRLSSTIGPLDPFDDALDVLLGRHASEHERTTALRRCEMALPDLDDSDADVATYWALSAASSGLEAKDVPKRALNAAAEALAAMAAHVYPNQAFDASEGHLPATLRAELDEHLASLRSPANRSPELGQAGDIPEH